MQFIWGVGWGGEQFKGPQPGPWRSQPKRVIRSFTMGARLRLRPPARTLWSGCEQKPQGDCARGEKQTGLGWTKQVLQAEKALRQRNAGAGRQEAGVHSDVSRPWASGMSSSQQHLYAVKLLFVQPGTQGGTPGSSYHFSSCLQNRTPLSLQSFHFISSRKLGNEAGRLGTG